MAPPSNSSMDPARDKCEDCEEEHPAREGTGPCLKCTKLRGHARDSLEYKDILSWPQCAMCSVTRRTMPAPRQIPTGESVQLCASSRCLELAGVIAPQSSIQLSQAPVASSSKAVAPMGPPSSVPATYQDRALSLAHRLKLTSPGLSMGATSDLSSAILMQLEHHNAPPNEREIQIAWQVRLSKSAARTDARFGKGSRKFAESRFIPDVKAELVEQVQGAWQQVNTYKLLPEEVEFRFADNKPLITGTATMTVGQFFVHYSDPSLFDAYMSYVPPSNKKLAKKPLLCLELYVNCEGFNKRVNPNAVSSSDLGKDFVGSTLRDLQQRSTRQTSAGDGTEEPDLDEGGSNSNAKRQRSSGVYSGLTSTFSTSAALGGQLVTVQKCSSVSLCRIECRTSPADGQISFEDRGAQVKGFLQDRPFASGKMKLVFELTTSSAHLVAKKFFRLSEPGEDGVEQRVAPKDNEAQLQGELAALSKARWFLAEFYQFAERRGVEVDQDVEIADAYLGKEQGSKPSGASAYQIPSDHLADDGLDDSESEPEVGFVWLIERRRPTTVVRISGTLVHPSARSSLLMLTIVAFAHFTYIHSKKSLVLADLQGTHCQIKGKRDGFVLFDIMTHTLGGSSCVGDFGQEGINSFIRDHKCNTVCRRMTLEPINASGNLAEGEDEDDE